MIIFKVVVGIVYAYFLFNTIYLLIYSIAGLLYKQKQWPERPPETSFCVMVPAYRGDEVIISSVIENLKQQYPQNLYDIYVIADSFRPETLERLKAFDVKVIEVAFENSTKAKAINKAFEVIEEKYDYVVLLDVDNVMEPEFLQKLNNRLVKNVQIIQAHRKALNVNTPFAILDALSEEMGNTFFRRGHAALGLSSALIGSAKAAGFRYFKDVMKDIDAVGGFDKELELKVIRQRVKIYYLDYAIVYDEKVQAPEVFQNQRRRWLYAQLFYLRKYFFSAFKQLFYGNFDYADKMLQYLLAPRVLLLGFLVIITAVLYIFGLWAYAGAWLVLLLLCGFALAIAVPRKYYNRKTFSALSTLPKAFILFFGNLFKLRGANKKFIHTPHGKPGNNP